MPISDQNRSNQTTATCEWCGKEFSVNKRGRPRKFCGVSCKQRAYENRNNRETQDVDKKDIVLSARRYEALKDGLFELRCAAEDIATAASEGESPAEMGKLCGELIALARRIEDIR